MTFAVSFAPDEKRGGGGGLGSTGNRARMPNQGPISRVKTAVVQAGVKAALGNSGTRPLLLDCLVSQSNLP
jgi:hypothetical protein